MKNSELTPREGQIMILVSRGMTSQEIGKELGIVAQSVKNHMTSVRAKLEANNTTHAVAISISKGLIII